MSELQAIIESAATCRYYKSDPVPDELLAQVMNAARFAPNGGNRQGVRFVVVRDRVKRQTLSDWYLEWWNATLAAIDQMDLGEGVRPKTLDDADHFANHLHEVPVLIVVGAVLTDLLVTDSELGRLSITGGASVYPAVENLLLKCRELGLGAALTTALCLFESKVKALLEIPDDVATAATIAMGFPAKPFPRRLSRRPLAEMAFVDRYGEPFPVLQ